MLCNAQTQGNAQTLSNAQRCCGIGDFAIVAAKSSRSSVRAMTTDPDTFDIGPTPPPWTLPGAQPTWDSLTEGGATVLSWTRDIGDQVWIAADTMIEDGRWVRGPTLIRFHPDAAGIGMDAAGARRLAGELLAAAGA
jgi:hypothetical protein